jgi:predicted alpha/beta-hydrolase family hydrolase
MRAPLIRKLSEAAADAGTWALRFNFRYVDSKSQVSWNFPNEVDDLLGGVRLARKECGSVPILIAGASMGARVCALASADPDVASIVALGYPLHPRLRPEVRNPPEWPKIVKPALFVQGDHDPFCDLARLREELARLPQRHELIVIRNAGHSFEPRGERRDTFPDVWAAVESWIRSILPGGNQIAW